MRAAAIRLEPAVYLAVAALLYYFTARPTVYLDRHALLPGARGLPGRGGCVSICAFLPAAAFFVSLTFLTSQPGSSENPQKEACCALVALQPPLKLDILVP